MEPRTNEHQRAHESDYFGLSTAAEARPEGTPHEGGGGGGGIYKLINNSESKCLRVWFECWV